MGKFRYIHLILILGLTSGLVVGFPGRSEVTDPDNNATTELEEICKPNENLDKKDLNTFLSELETAFNEYQTSRNSLFDKLNGEGETEKESSPTENFPQADISNIHQTINCIQTRNSDLKKKIERLEEEELEFHYFVFKQKTSEIYPIAEKIKTDIFTEASLRNIPRKKTLEDFKKEIQAEENKISERIQYIKKHLSKIEKITEQEPEKFPLTLLLQSLTLFMANAVVTLIILKIIFNTDNKSNQSRSVSADIRTIKNQIYNQLSQDFTGNDQFARKINQLIQSFNSLETRIATLEQTTNYYPQNPSSSITNRNYPSTSQTPLTKQITSLRSGNINFDEPAQPGIVEKYNLNAASLKTTAIPVLVTEESINETRGGRKQNIILQRERRGNYWIFNDGGTNYLVPKYKFNLNTFNSKTIEDLFECKNYQASSSRNFRLIKPARVSVVTTDQVWQLEERGVLQFE